jgi:hypothetical protein
MRVEPVSDAAAMPETTFGVRTSDGTWLLAGLGVALNLTYMAFGHFAICVDCSGLNAVALIPWPAVGLIYWAFSPFFQHRRVFYSAAGFCSGLALFAVGFFATGRVCLACLLHLGLLAFFLTSSISLARQTGRQLDELDL